MVQRKGIRARKSNPRKSFVQSTKSFYRDAWQYLKESQNFVYGIIIIFFVSALFGYIFNAQLTDLDELLKALTDQIEDLGQFELIVFIFTNNIRAAFFGLVLGMAFGIWSVGAAITNGVVLGYVSYIASRAAGPAVLVNLLPHGIFELPAIFISLGLGLKLGMFPFAPPGKKRIEFVRRTLMSFKVFFGIVLPLLVIAAVIEGTLIAISMAAG